MSNYDQELTNGSRSSSIVEESKITINNQNFDVNGQVVVENGTLDNTDNKVPRVPSVKESDEDECPVNDCILEEMDEEVTEISNKIFCSDKSSDVKVFIFTFSYIFFLNQNIFKIHLFLFLTSLV